MAGQISIFIMDISGSSKTSSGDELSRYLDQLKGSIEKWSENIMLTKVSHRAGDELVVISEGTATAYVLAFYISRLWKFKDFPPYFGLSFGEVEEDLKSIDINTWIHPLMKQARNANDYLKQQKHKGMFRFELPPVSNIENVPVKNEPFERLINSNIMLSEELMESQTDIQSYVCSLYLILAQQNKVSDYLQRTTATISHHIKQGRTQIILDAFHDIIKVLTSFSVEVNSSAIDQLQGNIKQDVSRQMEAYFKIDKG